MKAGWEEKKLEQFSKIMYGYTTSSSDNKIGPKFLRITDIQNNSVNWSDVPYCQISDSDYTKYKLKIGDIVFARTGATTGKSFLIENDIDSVFASYLIRVQADKNIIYPNYLYYYFQSSRYWRSIELGISGSAQGGFNAKKLSSLKIPLPPLSEQKQIVKVLDELFERIEKAKANINKNIENAEEMFQSRLKVMLSQENDNWIHSTIGEKCNLMTGGTPSKNKEEYFKNGNINWLVSGDIHKKIITDCSGKITDLGFENSNTKYLPINSVLIALNGQGKTRGTVAMLKIKATCNQSLVSIYPKNDTELLPEYIYGNLNSRYIELRRITGDDEKDRRGLNMPLIKKIKISYPKEVNEQKEIVKVLDELSAKTRDLKDKYNQKLIALDELKKAALEKAFRGELT